MWGSGARLSLTRLGPKCPRPLVGHPGEPKQQTLVSRTSLIDNLSSHKSPKIRIAIEATGAELHFLPRYSPDVNPSEMVFSKLKTLLLKASERTIEALWSRIGELLSYFPRQECENYFQAVGYQST
jgi:transposase